MIARFWWVDGERLKEFDLLEKLNRLLKDVDLRGSASKVIRLLMVTIVGMKMEREVTTGSQIEVGW